MRQGVLASLVLVPALAWAQTPDLDALQRRFDSDPLGAMAATEQAFQEADRRGDLDAMAAIGAMAEPWLIKQIAPRALGDMARRMLPKAEAAGRWALVGQAYLWRYRGASFWSGAPGPLILRRPALAIQSAVKAFERTGAVPGGLASELVACERQLAASSAGLYNTYAHYQQRLGPLVDRFEVYEKAVAEGRDEEAAGLASALVDAVAHEPDTDVRAGALAQLTHTVGYLQNGPDLVTALLRLAGEESAFGFYWAATAMTAAWQWQGQADLYHRTAVAAMEHVCRSGHAPIGLSFAAKCYLYGRKAEALQWAERVVSAVVRRYPGLSGANIGTWDGYVFAETPDSLRRTVTALACARTLRYGDPTVGTYIAEHLAAACAQAPPAQRAQWSLETGQELAACAPRIRYPEVRVKALHTAAKLMEDGGRPDLAEQARALALALSQGHPIALLACAVLAAQRAADSGEWATVIEVLTLGLAGAPPGEWWLQGSLLLVRAYVQNKQADQAEALVGTIATCLPQLTTNLATKVNALLDLAHLTTDASRKLAYLEVARRNAEEAGLDFVRERVASELADASLAQGQTDLAIRALIDLVEQQERKRDRLAFDPLLRRRWFAHNLASYRKLLDLAAQTNDAPLALWCGERMRARALMDQLAWRKLDFTAGLPPSLQQRARRLREKREEVGQLLRRVGSPVQEKSAPGESTRFVYVPLRGEQPTTDADLKRLRGLIAEVGEEEAALEAVIREQVPAYREATRVENCDPSSLIRRLPARTAVLELTLTEGAVVGLAIGPRRQVTVRKLELKSEDVPGEVLRGREEIGGFGSRAKEALALWHGRLVAPFADTLGDAQKLWVIADGELQLLPFAALLDGDGHYLVERYALATAPSLGVALATSLRSPHPSRPGLVVAAPNLGPTASAMLPVDLPPLPAVHSSQRDARGLSTTLLDLARVALPGAAAEGRAVWQRLPGSALLEGPAATKEAVLTAAPGQAVLHIATHGYADPEIPDLSGLLLAGAKPDTCDVLTASEVYLMRLDARLVTLSACETGLGQEVTGEGLLGLTRSFLYAGAREVVCSLWRVPDEPTAELMTTFYDAWRGDAASALREAQLRLVHTAGRRHPNNWAGFQAVIGPR